MNAQPVSFETRVARATHMALGGGVAFIAHVVAGWFVWLFGGALPLPNGTRAAVTFAMFALGTYYFAIVEDDDGRTLLDAVSEAIAR